MVRYHKYDQCFQFRSQTSIKSRLSTSKQSVSVNTGEMTYACTYAKKQETRNEERNKYFFIFGIRQHEYQK